MEAFYPIIKSIKTNQFYSKNYLLLSEMTEVGGECAVIYNIKNKIDNRKFILKFMEYDITDHDSEKLIYNEINIHEKCFLLGIAPEIIEAWICEKGAVIIMVKLLKTVNEILTNSNLKLELKHDILKDVIYIIKKMHENGITHGDTHNENFMVDISDDGKYRCYVIDFGASTNDSKRFAYDYDIFSDLLPLHLQKEFDNFQNIEN